jgi:hypothetical protein
MKPEPNSTHPTDEVTPAPKPPAGSANHRRLMIFAGVAVVVLLGGVAAAWQLRDRSEGPRTDSAANQPKSQNSNNSQVDDQFTHDYLKGCEDRAVSFSHSPVPLDQLRHIVPMGQMSDGHVTPTDHVYLAPTNQQAADNSYDVVMPADGTVTMVAAMPSQYIGDSQQQTAVEDHRLAIAHNCRYVSIFIHVHQLSDALKAAVGKVEPNTSKPVSIKLKAGDKLGRIGGNPVDWTLADAKTKLSGFITPGLYKQEPWKIHTIDPISVYSGAVKSQLIAKSLRTVEPYGGKIDYDKPGALIGNWFQKGTNGYSGASQERYWDGHLSIVPDHIDPAGTIVSIGNWQGKAKQQAVKGTVNPATVTAGSGPVKYELTDLTYQVNGQPWTGGQQVRGMKLSPTGPTRGTILVQVLAGEKLKVETFPGKAAAQVSGFTAAAKEYER